MAATTARKLKCYVVYIVLYFSFMRGSDGCILGNFDLKEQERFAPWQTVNEQENITYSISLCGALVGNHGCPSETSVCADYGNGTRVAYGFKGNAITSVEGDDQEMMLMLKGEVCSASDDDFYSVIFLFRCGKTLGSPRYLGSIGCLANFEWESITFCKDLPIPENEVPCSLVKDGQLIDLSPLTLTSGGHIVDENQNSKFLINVCRDIIHGKGTTADSGKCPNGAAACRVINGVGQDFGHANSSLVATSQGLKLVYTASTTPTGCPSPPTTIIHFQCPQRGGSKDPVLLSDGLSACSMEVEWLTEYACPQHSISTTSCKLTDEQHNVNVDLTPLSLPPLSDKTYKVKVKDGTDEYIYYINVCETLGYDCGNDKVMASSICQKKPNDASFSKNAGENRNKQLRYSDGKLTMVLKNGDKCHTNFRRTTLIDFYCNQTAVNDGKGNPEFVGHDNCTYSFSWGTKYACIGQTADGTCRVDVDGKRYDLSPLVREDKNWEVLKGEDESDTSYFLNVCHDVVRSGLASDCPQGSAICAKGESQSLSLGAYRDSLTYDAVSKSLKLVYTGGDQGRSGCQTKTTINFFCTPGNVDSAPTLVHKAEDGCYYELEWHSASACVLSHQSGDGCRVVDQVAGYVFDLSPLTKTEKGQYWSVSASDGFNYLINVCAPLSSDQYCTQPPHDGAAICQVEKATTQNQIKVAEASTKLSYYDGVLNLTYTGGEPYRDANKTPRRAEIAFLCDMTVKEGQPEFLEEKDFSYVFEWRTHYACPTPPIECMVTDEATYKQYDLSSLAKVTDNWSVMNVRAGDKKQKFYLNVCRPVTATAVGGVRCGRFAAACVTTIGDDGKETLLHGNLGKAESSPTIEKFVDGIKLVYTNGDDCEADGKKGKFQTSIHFVCTKGKVASGPTAPQLVNPCEYSILWQTEAACAVDDTKAQTQNGSSAEGDCTIKDPNTGFTFNLKPLAKEGGYTVNSSEQPGKSYKLNICGALKDDVCGKFENSKPTSVCEVTASKSEAVASIHSVLEYSSQGEITLKYEGTMNQGNGAPNTYILNFFCERSAQTPAITFAAQDRLSTTFRVETALACPPELVDCLVQDNDGRQYDLTPLAKSEGNWVVLDARQESHPDLRYHINVCRPVNPTPEMTCPGGAVGGCQTSTKGGQSFNMGYVQSKPVVADKGDSITIVYKGGDKCHAGTDREAFRSTRITFECDHTEQAPVFIEELETCEYVFMWRTPSACPLEIVTGADCKVTETIYDYEFDLSPLRNSTGSYHVQGGGYEFLLNVCGPLQDATGNCAGTDVGACQTGSTLSEPVQTGKFNSAVQYDAGHLSLVYKEGKGSCHGKYERSTIINFLCDQSTEGLDGPKYLDEQSDCTYIFEWKTSYACPPYHVTDCAFQHGNDQYDLSPLARTDSNYEKLYSVSKEKYILNVCRSVVHTKGETCPFTAASCMIDLAETDPKKKFHNLGEVTSHEISYTDGILTLTYENGEPCEHGGNRKTIILFECDKDSDALGIPESHYKIDCADHFLWTSRAACPLSTQTDTTTSEDDFGDCKVKNPNTGYEFDLSGLKRSGGYTTYDREGHEYTLNVCGWLSDTTHCKNGTGSCQTQQMTTASSVNAGLANARLQYMYGVLTLHYKDGEVCEDGSKRETFINFVCMRDAGTGVPVYVDKSDNCVYQFDWHTSLACEIEVKCEVPTSSGNTIDLSPLVKRSGKYNVLPNTAGSHHDPGLIYLNLCRPLNPIFGVLCPPGSGACLSMTGQKPVSLGRVTSPPTYDKSTREIKITYDHGDPCPSHPDVNASSVIILKCGNSEYQEPELDEVTPTCQYVFVWETPVACEGEVVQKLDSSCTFKDTASNITYDLSSISGEQEVIASFGGKYKVQICGHFDEKGDKGQASCDHSSVCLTGSKDRDGSYGLSSEGTFTKEANTISLQFKNGKSCGRDGSSKAMSKIYFTCDRAAGHGRPTVVEHGDCEVTFEWKTAAICPPMKKDCEATGLDSFDLYSLSRDTGSWTYTDKDENIYWLNLCQPLHGRAITEGCSPEAAVCMKGKTGEAKTLGALHTQTMTVEQGRSGLEAVIKYSEGDPDVCMVGRRRRSDLSPKVIIRLSCGTSIGGPVYQASNTANKVDCIFEFHWKTRLACSAGSSPEKQKELDGQIKDPVTGALINLKPLLDVSNPQATKTVEVDNVKYLIQLGGPLSTNSGAPGTECQGASVCRWVKGADHSSNLGSFASKAYFMNEERLEVVFTSPVKCEGKPNDHNVTSTIIFNCREGAVLTDPEFLYQFSNCAYFFTWDTSAVCIHFDQSKSVPTVDTGDQPVITSKSGSSVATRVGVGIAIVVSIALVCVIVFVVRNPERRVIVASKIKRVIFCRKSESEPMTYSRLSQADDLEDDHDPFNPFNEPDEESELNTYNLPRRVKTFHDESDEDLLL